MVINTTRWSPDTCQCIFEYDWDSTQNEDVRVHTFKQVVQTCASHAHLTGNGNKDMFDSSIEENTRKNNTVKEMFQRLPDDITELDPYGNIQLKRGLNISWEWSGTAPNRVMTITLTGITLSAQKKTLAQNFLDQRFGVGKVVFVN